MSNVTSKLSTRVEVSRDANSRSSGEKIDFERRENFPANATIVKQEKLLLLPKQFSALVGMIQQD
jgi:hypothetical protein